MDQGRRERIRVLIRMLQSVQEQLDGLCLDEEVISAPSSQLSSEAALHLEAASLSIQDAIERMQDVIGDAPD